jgi:SAM-dependent methyltransferase
MFVGYGCLATVGINRNVMSFFRRAARIKKVLGCYGIGGTLSAVKGRFLPATARTFPVCRELVAGNRGFEIGGPSPLFAHGGLVPIYPLIHSLDNCNFADHTMWEGALSEGQNFLYDPQRQPGFQYIAEASDLSKIPSGKYDFVLSCHSLEHVANPLGALVEWLRVLNNNGGLVLILPHKECTFDHRRPTTTLEHLVKDFESGVGENDTTHVEEILKLHDIDLDPGVRDFAEFKQRDEKANENRSRHHHVFDTSAAIKMVDYAGFQIRSVEAARPFHIIISGQKVPAGRRPDNRLFLPPHSEWRRSSPFRIDRTTWSA